MPVPSSNPSYLFFEIELRKTSRAQASKGAKNGLCRRAKLSPFAAVFEQFQLRLFQETVVFKDAYYLK